MKGSFFWSRKTKKAAERLAAEWHEMNPESGYRVVHHEGLYWVGRNWHPSDKGRSYLVLEVSS